LKSYLKKIKYPRLRVIKGWCRELLLGIKYLHEQSPPIIHRDIKCDNIFIDSTNGKLTIGDLGYSCVLKNEFANSFSGTPEFMAPEVFDSKYGTKADIYSFGMSVLEMVTLEKPYKECENILNIYTNAKEGKIPKALNRIKSEVVKNFILLCLKKENERPSANDLLEYDFLNSLECEENNFAVPVLDEEGNYIINEDYIHIDHIRHGFNKLKSHEFKKSEANSKRNSIDSKANTKDYHIKTLFIQSPFEQKDNNHHYHHQKSKNKIKNVNSTNNLNSGKNVSSSDSDKEKNYEK